MRLDVYTPCPPCRVPFAAARGRVFLLHDDFEAYYRRQHLVDDEELPAFFEKLKTPLPLDVRVSHRAALVLVRIRVLLSAALARAS